MSDAPERIWAWGHPSTDRDNRPTERRGWEDSPYHAEWFAERDAPLCEYVRADIHAAPTAELDRLRADLAAAEALVAECAEYLKEGETPRQRMDRDHMDVLALMDMLAKDRTERDALRARLAPIVALAERIENLAMHATPGSWSVDAHGISLGDVWLTDEYRVCENAILADAEFIAAAPDMAAAILAAGGRDDR